MAIAANWVVTAPYSTTTALYTTPTAAFAATAGTYLYQRDLVITNNGASTMFVAVGTGASSAVTTSSFALPSGGSVILTQCQVPNAAIIYGVGQGGAAGTASIGWGTNVSYV